MRFTRLHIDYLLDNYEPENDGTYLLTDERIVEISQMIMESSPDGETIEAYPNDLKLICYESSMGDYKGKRKLVQMSQAMRDYIEIVLFGERNVVEPFDYESSDEAVRSGELKKVHNDGK